ncbi:MAG: TetR/AcrR family transcriptional regulator [Sphingobium sp.]|nr:TetR/AcrR family transcriptional regulator [Sphingobium sp.]
MSKNAYGVNKQSARHGDLREALIASALAALERGEDVGLRAMARAAGVSAMAPYRHFRDKAALLGAVAMRGFDDLHAALLAADAQDDAREALVAQGEAYLAFARSRPALFRLMFAGDHDGPPPVGDNAYGVMVRRVEQLAPDNLEAATLLCWSTVHGLATLALDGGLPAGGSPHEKGALRLMVAGLAR